MSSSAVYSSMLATDFQTPSIADEYVTRITQEIVPRVRASGALSARVVVFRDDHGVITGCESQYTWSSLEALSTYRQSEPGKGIRDDVAAWFGSKAKLTPKSGVVALEDIL